MSNYNNIDSSKAFDYPTENSNTQSGSASQLLNKKITNTDQKNTNLIDLIEGKTSKFNLSGGAITNGGLNSGELCQGSHCAIPINPTSDNYIHNNLHSANPPPGADKHYPSLSRLGNSFSSQPGISKYYGTNINPDLTRVR